ncbi:MAG: pyridoxal phosphate-dependent aminotransferase [Oscillospiraceae bacterium]|jgi:cystathionine beta-lyase|nr:pyridoxal phosphate-dependent aminotransferase [Oscillospiraceae bacterium]
MPTEFDFTTLRDREGTAASKWSPLTAEDKALGVVPLTVADMELLAPPCVMRAMEEAARHGIYGYTYPDAEYLDAVQGWMCTRHDWAIEPDWIIPVSSVATAMSVAVRAFTQPGEKVLLQTPGYPPFRASILENGRQLVESPLLLGTDGRYRMDLEDLRQKASDPAVTMMFLCSPHNPVGRIWTVEELRQVAEICMQNDVLVVSDEIHFDLELNGRHTVLLNAVPELRERCAILTSISKTFNTAGLHVSNTIIPGEALRKAFVQRLNADGGGGLPFFGRQAVIAAYREGAPWLDALLEHVRGNFAVLGDWLKEHLPMVRPIPIEGTYLAWTDWRALGLPVDALERKLREEAHVLFNNGRFFGEEGAGFFRINLAVPRGVLLKELERLKGIFA